MSPSDLVAASAVLTGIALIIVLSLIIVTGVRAAVASARVSFARARRTISAARADLAMGEQHPRLIDTDTGHEYEWVVDLDDPGNSGYANVLDHDFAWPREDLERVAPLVELRSLDPSQIELLRRQLDQ